MTGLADSNPSKRPRVVPPYAGLGRECCPWCGSEDHGPEHDYRTGDDNEWEDEA